MSDIIHLLPDSVANQIAAGEVIQRPASVVKELVENAVDAEATEIHVLITDAGKTNVQVIDNGKGMSETDARLSFERHATSKIQQAADLFALHTMGFRGEALASIAAVAEVELKTRQSGDDLGTRLILSGSRVTLQEPTACAKGSNFAVKNLFFNVPARRKFLKSNTTELNNILTEFERIVLVNPTVAFYLYSNDAELFKLPAAPLKQRIIGVFGKRINAELLSVSVDTSLVKISGYVGRPDTSRKKGSHQYFFANGRYMRHPYFHRAVMDAYEKLIPTGEQVSYFIYMEVDPAHIDINIHPTKTEIKFENEQAIWQILSAVVRETLGKACAVPQIDFDTADMPDIPVMRPGELPPSPPRMSLNPTYNPFQHTNYPPANDHRTNGTRDWEKLYEGLERMPTPLPDDNQPTRPIPTSYEEPADQARLFDDEGDDGGAHLLQYAGRYIVSQVSSGIRLVDQHRAHVCVLFHRYRQRLNTGQGVSQGMLFPELVDFPPSEAAVLRSLLADLASVGFDLTDLGGGSFAIGGIPPGIEGLNPAHLLTDMVHSAIEKGSDVKEEVRNAIALTLANASAIPYGQALNPGEMAQLLKDLFACPQPNYTPDGHVVVALIGNGEIDRLFGR